MKSIKYRQIRKGNLVYCMRCLNVFFYLYGSDYLLKTDLNTLQLFRQHDKYLFVSYHRIISVIPVKFETAFRRITFRFNGYPYVIIAL